MKQAIQLLAIAYGDGACYLDSLIDASGSDLDRLKYLQHCIDNKWMQENCFVIEPEEILQDLTSRAWNMHKECPDYKCKPGEIEILRFEWISKPGTTLGHFVHGDGNGSIAYDPMGDRSPVAKYGTLVSKRIFTEAV